MKRLRHTLTTGLTAMALLLVPIVSWATPILVPSGLSAGDTYHLVFVSSTTRNAVSADITDYDAHVQAAADNAAISIGVGSAIGNILWSAIGSTATVDAKTHIGVSGPVFRLDGLQVATGEADLFGTTLINPININENEQTFDTATYTGTLLSGLKHPTANLGATDARFGRSNLTGSGWINDGQVATFTSQNFTA